MKSPVKHTARQPNKPSQPFFSKQGPSAVHTLERADEIQEKPFFSPDIQNKGIDHVAGPHGAQNENPSPEIRNNTRPSLKKNIIQHKTKRDYPEGFVDDEDQMYQSPIQLKEAEAPGGIHLKVDPVVQRREKRDYPEGFVDDEDQMAQSPIQLKEVEQVAFEGLNATIVQRKGKRDYPEGFVDDEDQMYQSPIQLKENPVSDSDLKARSNSNPGKSFLQIPLVPYSQTIQSKGRTFGLPQPGFETRLDKSKGSGQPLAENTKAEMETSFGADFEDVRVHTDPDSEEMSQDLGAQAFTHGADIYFNKGKYQPNTMEGRKLLAHELTHTLQQGAAARLKPEIQLEEEPTKEEMLRDLETSNEEQRDAFDPTEAKETRREAEREGTEAMQKAEAVIPEVISKEPEALPQAEEGGNRVAVATPKKPDKVVPHSKPVAASQADPAAGPDAETKETADTASKAPAAAGAGGEDAAPAEAGAGTGGGGGAAASGAGADAAEGGGAAEKGPVGQSMDQESSEVCAKGAEKAQELADNESAHDTAEEKAAQTDVAVVPPGEEGQSRSNAEQVNTLDKAEAPEANPEDTKREMNEAIGKAVPAKIEELNEFESEKRAQVIGNKVLADTQKQVGDVQGTYNDIEEAPPPAESETPVALPQIEQAPQTPELNMGKDAVPELKAEDTDFSEYENQAEDIYEKEGISPDMKQEFEQVDSGDIAEANKEKVELKKKVQDEPANIQSFAEGQKQGVEKDLQEEEAKGKASMQKKRKDELEGAKGKQEKTKTEMEKKREAVTNWINERYDKAKNLVTEKLKNLETQALATFDAGQKKLSIRFEQNVKRRVNAWKRKRYSGFWGGAKWIKDKFVGIDHFQEIKDIFSTERASFVKGVDNLIIEINKENDKTIQSCKDELTKAKEDIAKYVADLGPALKDVGLKAQKETDKKLAELDQHIEAEKKKLQQKLCDKKEEAIKAIDEKIEKMKSEMSGLVGKLGALLLYAAKKFFKWVIEKIGGNADKIMGIINKGASVLKKIFTDPIGFFKNLGKAVGGGIKQFVTNIVKWLKKGLVGWLMGAMGDSGLELPEKFNLKGILFLGLQVAGLTWNIIRARLVKRIGPKGETVVSTAEKGIEIINRVRKEGPIALWNIIVEKAAEIKSKVMEGIRNWAITKIIQSATIKLISMLNPAGAIFQAIMLLYKTVMFFVDNWQRIIDFVNSVFDSIGAISKGALGQASNFIEQTLGKTIPIMLSFLAKFIGLGGIGKAIKRVIKAIQRPFKKILDKIIKFLVKQVKKLFGKGKKGKEKTSAGDKTKAVKELKKEDKRIAKDGKMTEKEAKQVAKTAKNKNKAFKSITVKEGGGVWKYDTVFRSVDGSLIEGGSSLEKFFQKAHSKSPLKNNLVQKSITKNLENEPNPSEQNFQENALKTPSVKSIHSTPLAESKPFGKYMKGKALDALKNAAKAVEAKFRGNNKNEEADEMKKLQGSNEIKVSLNRRIPNIHKGGAYKNSIEGLRDTIFDKTKENNSISNLEKEFENVLLGKAKSEHKDYEPKIKQGGLKVVNQELIISYDYDDEATRSGGKRDFTAKIKLKDQNGKKVIQTTVGKNLGFKEPGSRGKTEQQYKDEHRKAKSDTSSKPQLNSAHILADRFMGSGYKRALNLLVTSKEFNQITMADREKYMAQEIEKIQIRNPSKYVTFNMTVIATWESLGDDSVIKILKSLHSNMTENELKITLSSLSAKKDPQKCESVNYEADVYLNGEYEDTVETKTPSGDIWL